MSTESAHLFDCGANQLVGIHHHSNKNVKVTRQALIIVVGGPQTRIGSHRFFVDLARHLAKQGIDVFRFDYTGAGDSSGQPADFCDVQQDIKAAVGFFKTQLPSQCQLSLWGLCDAASAISMYLLQDKQKIISQVFLLNPWVHQTASAAKVKITSYYWQRICSIAFWKKLLQGRVKLTESVSDLKEISKDLQTKTNATTNYLELMYQGLKKSNLPITVILSEQDLVAQEFLLLIKSNLQWQKLIASTNVSLTTVNQANHTFAKKQWKDEVIALTANQLIC